MNFIASSTSVLRAVSKVIGAVNKTSISEYLMAVKVSVTNQFLIEATNMDVAISAWFDIDSANVQEQGAFCVDAYSLYEIVKKLPKDVDVKFHVEEAGKKLKYLIIQSGKSKFDLGTLDVENYPTLSVTNPSQSIKFLKDDLSFLIDKTKPCIYANETRYNINGLLFHLHADTSKIFAISTDGHRLGYACVDNATISETKKYTIPKKVINEIKKLIDNESENITLDLSDNRVTFNFENSRLTTKLIDAEFPDYQRVIPKDYQHHFSVNTKNFLTSIDRVSSIYLNTTNEIGVRLTVNQTSLKISSIRDINRSFDELPATFTDENQLEIMCNFLYLKEILSLIESENVQIFVKDSTFPMMLQDSANSNFFYVIMPMKL